MSESIRRRVIVCLIAGAVAAASVMSGCGAFNKDEASSPFVSGDESSSQISEERVLSGTTAAKSEHFELPLSVISYQFNYYYSYYRDYAATYYGLDVTKSLQEQYYSEEQGTTWYDYFMEMTTQYITQLMTMCEAATDAGFKLEEAETKKVNDQLDSIRASADKAGLTMDEYIKKYFDEDLTEEELINYFNMSALAQKYYTDLYTSYKYSDEEYEKTYEENKTSYQYADFMKYNFSFADPDASQASDSSEVPVNQDLKDKAKAYADDLAKCTSKRDFEEYVRDYLEENPDLLKTEESQEMTEDEIEEAIDAAVEKLLNTKYAYEVTSEAGSWIFDEERKDNDTHVFENSDSYTVILVTKSAYRDESKTKNVRHILVNTETYGGSGTDEEKDAAAKKKADEIYDEWKKGEATEESFAELAKKYTAEPGTKETGGLIEDIVEGSMVTEFNDWVFDSSRKTGDTGIVKTSYGYHIMYFVKDGKPAWKKSVDTIMRRNSFSEDYQEFQEKYEITLDRAYLYTIKEKDFSEETSEQQYESQPQSSAESKASESSGEQSAENSAESSAEGSAEQTSETGN